VQIKINPLGRNAPYLVFYLSNARQFYSSMGGGYSIWMTHNLGGVGGMLPRENFNFWTSEMLFLRLNSAMDSSTTTLLY
jgi:hypothetical protein